MTLLCLAPLILAGYAGTIRTDWHHSADISGPYAEAQTCKDGFGARLAFSAEWVQVGPQVGMTWPISGAWSFTARINGGFGYSNTHHPATRVRQVTTLNAGASVSLNYVRYSLVVSYQHMSNGRGTDITNAGVDTWSTGVGYAF